MVHGDTDEEGEAGGNGSGGKNEAVYGRFNRAVELGQLGEQGKRRGITLIDGDDQKSFLKQEG